MKKNLLTLGLFLLAALSFTACSDDDDNLGGMPQVQTNSIYVACAGNYGANDGTVGVLDYDIISRPTNPFIYADIYQQQNKQGIGDAQDVIVVGNKVVVACTTSSKIEVLTREGKLESSVSLPKVSPRYLATDGTFVYFSAYDGNIYKMNPNDKNNPIVAKVAVGSYPEAISIANGKLYANMSDYTYKNTGKSISVVDLKTFTKTKELEVELNPYNQNISVGNKVYFVSLYHSENALVQMIDATTDKVTKLCKASAIAYSAKNNSLVCLYATYYDKEKRFFFYDLNTGKETDLDMTGLMSPQQVNVDSRGYIYVIDNPSYTTPSKVFCYDPTGKLIQGNITVGYSAQNIRFAN